MITLAKYQGVISVGIEVVWIHNLMVELKFHFGKSIVVYCDNQSAIQVVVNHVAHIKMKNVEFHAYYLR